MNEFREDTYTHAFRVLNTTTRILDIDKRSVGRQTWHFEIVSQKKMRSKFYGHQPRRTMDPLRPFDTNMQLMGKVLDLRAQKAEVISSNIANAETPATRQGDLILKRIWPMPWAGRRHLTGDLHEKHISLGPTEL